MTPTRWQSDGHPIEFKKHGVVAFVTNGSWIDGNVDSGVRACLTEEFSSVYVLNLRGNARTSGERQAFRRGKRVWWWFKRAPVAITLLVKNSERRHMRAVKSATTTLAITLRVRRN